VHRRSAAIVTPSDYVAVRDRIGQTLDSTNCRYDVNADGAINTSDYISIRGRLGTTAGTSRKADHLSLCPGFAVFAVAPWQAVRLHVPADAVRALLNRG